MKICNGTFDAETPELADIFARWPFPLSDFQKFAIDANTSKNIILSLLPTQETAKHLPADFAIITFYWAWKEGNLH